MSVGGQFYHLWTQLTNKRFAHNSAPLGKFRFFLAHRNRVRIAQLSYIFAFSTYRPPSTAIRDSLVFRGLRACKKFRCRPGPETGQKRCKSGFFRSSGPFTAKCLPTKFDRTMNAGTGNRVWGPMCPWGPRHGRSEGGLGPFRRGVLGRCLGRNPAVPGSFWAIGGSSEPRSDCAMFSKPTLRSVSVIFSGNPRFTGFCRFGTGFVG